MTARLLRLQFDAHQSHIVASPTVGSPATKSAFHVLLKTSQLVINWELEGTRSPLPTYSTLLNRNINRQINRT